MCVCVCVCMYIYIYIYIYIYEPLRLFRSMLIVVSRSGALISFHHVKYWQKFDLVQVSLAAAI